MNTKLAAIAIASGIIAISGCHTTPTPDPRLDMTRHQARETIATAEVEIELAIKESTTAQDILAHAKFYTAFVITDEIKEPTKRLVKARRRQILKIRTKGLPRLQTLVETTTGKSKELWEQALDLTNELLHLSSELVKTYEEILKLTSDNGN